MCSIFFFSENPTFYQIMWENIVEPDMPRMTIWRMRVEFWITEATDTHLENVILTGFSLRTMVIHKRLDDTFYVL